MEDSFFEWDHSAYIGLEPPYVVRHPDGRAQVVADKSADGVPMRVPGFILDKEDAELMDDQSILMCGLEWLRQLTTEVSRLGPEHRTDIHYKIDENGKIEPQ